MHDKVKKKNMLNNLLELYPNTCEFLDKDEADNKSNKNRQLAKKRKKIRNNKLRAQEEIKKLHAKFHKNKEQNN